MNALPLDWATGQVDKTSGMLVTTADFIATVLEYVGVDHRSWLPEGEVITALANA